LGGNHKRRQKIGLVLVGTAHSTNTTARVFIDQGADGALPG
jgi:hypothetical protein